MPIEEERVSFNKSAFLLISLRLPWKLRQFLHQKLGVICFTKDPQGTKLPYLRGESEETINENILLLFCKCIL